MKTAICPSCDAEIEIGRMPQLGMRVVCPICDGVFRIIWLHPPELDWWEEDNDDFENNDNDIDPLDDEIDDEKIEHDVLLIMKELDKFDQIDTFDDAEISTQNEWDLFQENNDQNGDQNI